MSLLFFVLVFDRFDSADASFGGTTWAAGQRPPALFGSNSQLAMNELAIRNPAAGVLSNATPAIDVY